MQTIQLPEDIVEDIEAQFGYRPDQTYQDRAHEYIEEWGVQRTSNDTAVQAEVLHLCERAYQAAYEGIPASDALRATLLETAAKCTRAAVEIDKELSEDE